MAGRWLLTTQGRLGSRRLRELSFVHIAWATGWRVLTSCVFVPCRLHIIDRRVARGTHYVECQLLGEEDDRNVPPFKIIGIFAT